MSTKLNSFLQALEAAGIYFTLSKYRHGAISVLVEVPGEHWEIDFLDDGSIDVERFKSNGEIAGEEAFEELFARFSDAPAPAKKEATVRRARAKRRTNGVLKNSPIRIAGKSTAQESKHGN